MPLKTRSFDVAEYLETSEDIKIFLQDAAEGTPEEFIHAFNTAARAMGMTEVAKKAGVTRASLYKSLSEDGNPKLKLSARSLKLLATNWPLFKR